MAEKVILQVDVQGEGNLKRMDQNMGKFGKSTNTTQNELKRLRKELNDAKSDMASAEKGTEAYTRALNRSIVAQNKITEVNQKVRIATMDTGQTARYVASSISGLASGFQAAVGVMHLFGVENDKMLESIQKLQAIMSITQGLSQFSDSIHSMSQLFKSFGVNIEVSSNATKAFNDDVAKSGQVADKASEGIDKVSGKSAHMASNLAGLSSVNESVGKSFDSIRDKLTTVEASMLKHDLAILKTEGDTTGFTYATNNLIDSLGGEAASTEELIEHMEKRINQIEAGTQATKTATKANNKFISSLLKIGKTILTMIAFTAVLWAISEAIGFIIKQINKIPKELEIKIKLSEDVHKQMIQTETSVGKFVNDYRKAVRDANKERIAQLKQVAREEYNLNQTQLDLITKTEDGWKEAFKDYLDTAEKTYEAEYIIKEKARVKAEKKIQEAIMTAAEDEIKAWRDTQPVNIQKEVDKTLEDLDKQWLINIQANILGQVKTWRAANKKLKEAADEYEAIMSLDIPDIDFGIKGKGSTSFKDTQAWKDFEKTYDANKIQAELDKFEDKLKRDMKIGIDLEVKIEPIFPKTTIEEDEASVKHYLDYIAQLLNQGEIDYEDYLNRKIEYLKRAEALGHDEWETSYLVEKELLDRKLRLYQDYINSISDTMSGIAGIYAAQMTEVDNYYKKEEELVNASVMGEKQKEKLLNDIAWARYEEQLVIFEKQKKAEEAAVWMNLASGLMGVYANAVRPDRLNPIVAWVQAGLETIALTTQAFASVKQIRAQRLDKPTQSSSSGAGNSVSLALNPTQTALTTKEENLNMIQQSNKTEAQAPVVKVSEINEVQNKVSVRESNTTY